MADEADIISREDLNSNKNIFMEQQLYAIKIADIYNAEVRKRLTQGKKFKTVFPSAETLYNKDVVKEMDTRGGCVVGCKTTSAKKKHYEEDHRVVQTPPTAVKQLVGVQNKINTIKKEVIQENTSSSNETTSTGSAGVADLKDLKEDFAGRLAVQEVHHKLFTNRDRSRFEFAKGAGCLEVPKFVTDLIFKKVSRHKLTRNIKNSEDILYNDTALEDEYFKNNSWAQFIVDNKSVDDDWEFIQDFDFINGLVLDKGKANK
jgi:hypothetical protein